MPYDPSLSADNVGCHFDIIFCLTLLADNDRPYGVGVDAQPTLLADIVTCYFDVIYCWLTMIGHVAWVSTHNRHYWPTSSLVILTLHIVGWQCVLSHWRPIMSADKPCHTFGWCWLSVLLVGQSPKCWAMVHVVRSLIPYLFFLVLQVKSFLVNSSADWLNCWLLR